MLASNLKLPGVQRIGKIQPIVRRQRTDSWLPWFEVRRVRVTIQGKLEADLYGNGTVLHLDCCGGFLYIYLYTYDKMA